MTSTKSGSTSAVTAMIPSNIMTIRRFLLPRTCMNIPLTPSNFPPCMRTRVPFCKFISLGQNFYSSPYPEPFVVVCHPLYIPHVYYFGGGIRHIAICHFMNSVEASAGLIFEDNPSNEYTSEFRSKNSGGIR